MRFPSLIDCTGSESAELVPRAVWEGMDPDLVQVWGQYRIAEGN